MQKNKIKKILSLFILILLLIGFLTPFYIQAEMKKISTDGNAEYTLLETLPKVPDKTNNMGKYLESIFNLAIGIASVLAVLMIVIGGFKYITVEASPYSVEEAKNQINGALLGLVLVLAAWLILNTINTNLVNFNTNLDPVVPTASQKTTKSEIIQKVEDKEILKDKSFFSGDKINMEKLKKAVKNGEITLDELDKLSRDPKTPIMYRSKIKNLYKNIKNNTNTEEINIDKNDSDEFTGLLGN